MKDKVSNLGRNIKAYRLQLGMSQTVFAKKAGVSLYTIAKIEGGSNSDPKITTVIKIARALAVGIDQLI